MSSDYERMKARLEKTPYLAANPVTGKISLVTEAEAFRLMAESGHFPTHVIMHLRGGLDAFARIKVREFPTETIGKADREFRLSEIAKIMGSPYVTAYSFCQKEILRPSIRGFGGSGRGEECQAVFSWQDAFLSGVVGTLRRHGMTSDALKKVFGLFEERKRPKPKRGTSARA